MRLRIVACAALLAGACAGGHQAHPAGVYEARVTTGHGPVQVVWLDRASGRFRVRTVQGPAQGAHRFGTVTVFDGSRATTAFRGGINRYVGSAAFVADEARPAAVDVLEQRLQGAPAPRGDTVTILRRSATAPPGLFQLGTGRVWGTVREVRPGRRVSGAGPQYWLGPTWSGRPPRYASVSTFSSGAEYSVTYPGISVDAGRRLGAPCAGTRVTLSDGTPGERRHSSHRRGRSVQVLDGDEDGLICFVGRPGRVRRRGRPHQDARARHHAGRDDHAGRHRRPPGHSDVDRPRPTPGVGPPSPAGTRRPGHPGRARPTPPPPRPRAAPPPRHAPGSGRPRPAARAPGRRWPAGRR